MGSPPGQAAAHHHGGVAIMETYGRRPLTFTHGRGVWLWDHRGDRYLDCVAGVAVCSLGHSDPVLERKLGEQLCRIQHISNLYFSQEQTELAAWITRHSCMDAVFFCNSGAEANEAAIKLVRKYSHLGNQHCPTIVTACSSFHGRTLASLSATGQPQYQEGFEPLVEEFHHAPYNDFPAWQQCIDEQERRGRPVAAVMLEPLQGEGGVRPGDAAFFQALRHLCTKRQILLILDEVQVGMGRSGELWGYQKLGIEPDAITMAKGLGGGFPIGALAVQSHCNLFRPGDHGSTFGGNPLACRAALTVGEEIERRGLLAAVKQRGEQLRSGLDDLAVAFPRLCDSARGWGLIQGLVLRDEGPDAKDVVQACLEQKLLVAAAGSRVVRFIPALTISRQELAIALQRLRLALVSLCS